MYHIRPANPSDQADLLALCAVPIKGMISLAFERNPDFFIGCAIQCDEPELYVCENADTGHLVGMFATGKRHVWLNGQPDTVRYFSDLRVADPASGSRVLFTIARYAYEQGLANIPAQTIIFSDNSSMFRLFRESTARSRKLRIPYYHPAGHYHSYMLSLGLKPQTNPLCEIRRAGSADIPALQAFYNAQAALKNGSPRLHFGQIGTSPRYQGLSIEDFFVATGVEGIIGICGVWDQKSFKQTRVVAYESPLRYVRRMANWLRPLTGAIHLPAAGTCLPYLTLHSTFVRDNDPAILRDLLAFILSAYRKSEYAYLLGGVFEQDPLSAAYAAFRNKRTIHSDFFWVYAQTQLPPTLLQSDLVPYFEVATI
jgi:hypothetical protein